MNYEDTKMDLEMTKRRVNILTQEYEMLKYTFSSASILFKEI